MAGGEPVAREAMPPCPQGTAQGSAVAGGGTSHASLSL